MAKASKKVKKTVPGKTFKETLGKKGAPAAKKAIVQKAGGSNGAGYAGHRSGSRKGDVHKVYDDKGREAAVEYGLKEGLTKGTLSSWVGAWRRKDEGVQPRAKTVKAASANGNGNGKAEKKASAVKKAAKVTKKAVKVAPKAPKAEAEDTGGYPEAG